MSYEMSKACDEISALLDKKVIVSVQNPSCGFYSSIFLLPKKTGDYRPIINLKKLNSFVGYNHFKMGGMESVKFLIRQGDWLAKLDLKDAYLTVPVKSEHEPFLRFSWRDRRFQFTYLPFGLSLPPAFIRR